MLRAIWITVAFVLTFVAPCSARVAVREGLSANVVRGRTLGCRSASSLRDVVKFNRQNDKEAVSKAIAIFIKTGTCFSISLGQTVFVVKSDETDDVITVRRKGDIEPLHIVVQALMSDDEVVAWEKAKSGDLQVGRLDRMCAAMPKSQFCSAFYFSH